MGETRIKTEGFLQKLLMHIADNFEFGENLIGRPLKLEYGRHLFEEEMPEVGEIRQTSTSEYDEEEPVMAAYIEPVGGVDPAVGWGGRMESTVRFLLRRGVVPAVAVALLDQFYIWALQNLKGKVVGVYQIKTCVSVSRPAALFLADDSHAYAGTTLRMPFVNTL